MGGQETPHQEQGEISELENKIIQQIEYYFGDYNMRRDRFLKEQLKLDDGWVPLETMIKFNRLKILSEDTAVIASALKKSTRKLLEVSEDDTKIRRCVDKPVQEFSPEVKTDLDSRTVYVKRFPATTTLDELLQFFKGFGNIESIYMKKKPNKQFKGSVFVNFVTKEEAQNFLKLTDVTFNNSILLMESKESYGKRKADEYQQRLVAKAKRQEMNAQSKKEAEEKNQSETQDTEIKITKGCILKLSGLSETTTKEDIYEVFAESKGDFAYLDYSRGKPEAYIRFIEGIAQSILDKHSKKNGDDDKDMDDEKDDSGKKCDAERDETKKDETKKDEEKDEKVDEGIDEEKDEKVDEEKDEKVDEEKDEKVDEEKDEKMDDKVEAEDKEQKSRKTIHINGVDSPATVLEGELEIEYWQKFTKARAERKQRPYIRILGKGRFKHRTGGKDKSRHGKRAWKKDRSEEKERSDGPPRKMMKRDNTGNNSD